MESDKLPHQEERVYFAKVDSTMVRSINHELYLDLLTKPLRKPMMSCSFRKEVATRIFLGR